MSRSLAHLLPLRQRVEPAILATGFWRFKGGFRRDVNDVSWFFDWQRPYDEGGVALVHPLIAMGSQVWRDKTKGLMPVEPGAAQFEAGLASLASGWRAKGFPIDEARWEASAEQIVGLWEGIALPLLRSVRSTDDLIAALRERPWAGRGTAESEAWSIDVWEGRIDPVAQPFVRTPDPLAGKEIALEELIRLMRKGDHESDGTPE